MKNNFLGEAKLTLSKSVKLYEKDGHKVTLFNDFSYSLINGILILENLK